MKFKPLPELNRDHRARRVAPRRPRDHRAYEARVRLARGAGVVGPDVRGPREKHRNAAGPLRRGDQDRLAESADPSGQGR